MHSKFESSIQRISAAFRRRSARPLVDGHQFTWLRAPVPQVRRRARPRTILVATQPMPVIT